MHNCIWWCHPPTVVHLPPRNSQLVPASSVGKVLSNRTTASSSHLPSECLSGTQTLCASHSCTYLYFSLHLPARYHIHAAPRPIPVSCVWWYVQCSCNGCQCHVSSCPFGTGEAVISRLRGILDLVIINCAVFSDASLSYFINQTWNC